MIPHWQLVQRYGKHGRWLPKLQKFVQPIPTGYSLPLGQSGGSQMCYDFRTGFEMGTANKAGQHTGNLENEEYRFYSGHPYMLSNYSCCRCCLEQFNNATDRTKHKTNGCMKALVAAQKLLQAQSLCLICEEKTRHRCWGWNICIKKECFSGWKYHIVQPLALRNAIERTEYARLLTSNS